RVDKLAQQVTQIQHDVDELKAAAARAAAQPAMTEVTVPGATANPAPQPAIMPVPAPARTPDEDPVQMYQSAYRDYQRGNFDLAIDGFRDFVGRNPNSDLADNAAYWVGVSRYSQEQYRDAIAQCD